MPKGKYNAQWINPATGAVLQKIKIKAEGGKAALISPLYKTDIALKVVSTSKK